MLMALPPDHSTRRSSAWRPLAKKRLPLPSRHTAFRHDVARRHGRQLPRPQPPPAAKQDEPAKDAKSHRNARFELAFASLACASRAPGVLAFTLLVRSNTREGCSWGLAASRGYLRHKS